MHPTTGVSSSLSTSPTKHKTLYFGYGSNLWRDQMRKRCSTSKYLGIARLKGYEWFIYERGYANIVERKSKEHKNGDEHDYTNEVWGLVYSLEKEDERRLDGNEGVPNSYQKEGIECEFWKAEDEKNNDSEDGKPDLSKKHDRPDLSKKSQKVDMLVYINRNLTKVGKIKEEYIYRMNQGIKDAVKEGMPEEYVKQVLREYIPEQKDERKDEEVEDLAKMQAAEFEDER